jgi:hypothetical protein
MERVADDMAAGYKTTVNEPETITAAQPIYGLFLDGHGTVSHPIDRS